VKLKKDMSKEMAIIARAIPTISYNAVYSVGAFRHNNWRVTMEKREIQIRDIEKEADVIEVLDYLKGIVDRSDEGSIMK
jgi:hypothetical protein